MSITFVTALRSGGVYSPEWAERLNRQADEHLQPDYIECLSDLEVRCGVIPFAHNWPGWFSKIEMFRPGLFSGVCVYSDLDSLLLGPIPNLRDKLATIGKDGPPLWMLSDFFNPKIPASGVMMWTPCAETEAIYHAFAAKPELSPRWDRGDGYHIGRHPHLRLQTIFPGVFASFKAHKLKATSAGFPHISFHGKPKQPDFPPEHWVSKAWLGTNAGAEERRNG